MNDFRAGSTNPPTAPSWSAEEDADRLMDDVFSDIDDLLSGKQPSAKIQATPPNEYTSLQSLVVPQVDLDGIPAAETEAEAPELQVVTKRGWGYYTERLTFMGSCASLVGVALWMAVNDRLQVPRFLVEPTPVVEVTAEAEAAVTAEPIFADYVRRALDNIDRQPQAAPPGIPPTQPPTASTSDQQPPTPTSQVIERVYIPVYPPSVAANAQQSSAPVEATKPAQDAAPQTEAVAEQKPESASASSSSSSPPEAITQKPTEANDPIAAVDPPLPEIEPVAPVLAAPPAPIKEIYTLVGVLESGDRSAALFNIDGSTQRFKVGENIGASTWKLLSVQNQQVLMGQGGQTRSLFVGQEFGVER